MQYVGGFDRTTGGDSYQNKYNSGHIDAPAFDSEIKSWPGASTYIGFSYTGALLTNRGRGVDRIMLAGEVSQARMYQSKLTEAEVAAVADAPSAAGPKSDDLVLWLNFDPKNIVRPVRIRPSGQRFPAHRHPWRTRQRSRASRRFRRLSSSRGTARPFRVPRHSTSRPARTPST